MTQQEFEQDIQAGRFAEWARVHGNYYGTSKNVVEKVFSEGRSLLLDIDVQGADSLSKSYPKEAVLIFISPPSLEELEKRLRARGTDSEETIQKRVRNAREEMARKSAFPYVVINDSLDRAYSELKEIVKKEIRGSHG